MAFFRADLLKDGAANYFQSIDFIVPGMLAILLAVPAREQQAAKAVGLEAGALGALVMGGQPDLAAAGWESQILVCFLLGSAIEREFLGSDFG